MRKKCRNKCKKYKEFKKLKISCICDKTLFPPSICDKCERKYLKKIV